MAKLTYTSIVSLDGYVADEQGGIEWAAPADDVFAFINDLERPLGLHLYGRRMYEAMVFWETNGSGPGDSPTSHDFAAIWRAAEKIVYSRTLESPSTTRTRLEPSFDPAAIARLKHTAPTDIAIAGAEIAGLAIAAGLVDDLHLLIQPVLLGGGKPALPSDVGTRLELVDVRRFESGVVHLHFRIGA